MADSPTPQGGGQQFIKPGKGDDGVSKDTKGIRESIAKVLEIIKTNDDEKKKTKVETKKYKKDIYDNIKAIRLSFEDYINFQKDSAKDTAFANDNPAAAGETAGRPGPKTGAVKEKKESDLQLGALGGISALGKSLGAGIGGLIGGIIKGVAEGFIALANPEVILGLAIALAAFLAFTQIIKLAGKPFLDFMTTFADVVVTMIGPAIQVLSLAAITLEHLFQTLVDGLVKNPGIGIGLLAVGAGLVAVAAAAYLFGQPMAILGLTVLMGALYVFGKIVGTIGTPILDFLTRFSTIFIQYMPFVVQVIKILGDTIRDIAIGIFTAYTNVISVVIPAIISLFKMIAIVVGQVVIEIVKILGPNLPLIIAAIKTLAEAVMIHFMAIAKIIVPLIPVIINAIKELFVVLSPILTALVNVLVPAIKEIYLAFIHLYETAFKLLIPAIVKIVKVVVPAIKEIYLALINFYKSVMETLIPAIDHIVVAFMPVLTTLLDAVRDTLKIVDDVVLTFKSLVEGALNIVGKVMDTVQKGLDTVKSIFKEIAGVIKSIVDFIPNTIKEVSVLLEQFTSVLKELADANFGSFTLNAGKVAAGFLTIGAAILDLTGKFKDLKEVAPGFLGALNTAFPGGGEAGGQLTGPSAVNNGGAGSLIGLNLTNSLIAESNLYLRIIAEKSTGGQNGGNFTQVLSNTVQTLSEQRASTSPNLYKSAGMAR